MWEKSRFYFGGMGSEMGRVGLSGTLSSFSIGCLPLGHAACQLLYLLLLLSASSGSGRFGGGLLAGGAFQFLSFQLVFNFGGVCHV
jgi:hypothetical protein